MSDNPLLDELTISSPGVSMTLPSLGSFYEPGVLAPELDVTNAYVRPFSVWQEMTWRDPYAVMSGEALKAFFSICAPWVLKPEDILQVDAEAIILAAREASYGPDFEFEFNCLSCKEKSRFAIDLRHLLLKYKPITNVETWSILTNNGQTVILRPLVYRDIQASYKYSFEFRRIEDNIKMMASNPELIDEVKLYELRNKGLEIVKKLKAVTYVSSIKGVKTKQGTYVNDRGKIAQWINALPVADIKQIDDVLNTLTNPLRDLSSIKRTCSHCSHDNGDINLLDDPISFFGTGLND